MLLFGIVGIIAAFVLLVVATLSLVGMSAVAPVVAFVPILANVQWICVLAMVMLWGVSGHVPLAESLKVTRHTQTQPHHSRPSAAAHKWACASAAHFRSLPSFPLSVCCCVV